jgi:hypothetical protein
MQDVRSAADHVQDSIPPNAVDLPGAFCYRPRTNHGCHSFDNGDAASSSRRYFREVCKGQDEYPLKESRKMDRVLAVVRLPGGGISGTI